MLSEKERHGRSPIRAKQLIHIRLLRFLVHCHTNTLIVVVHSQFIVEIVSADFQFILHFILRGEETEIQPFCHSTNSEQLSRQIAIGQITFNVVYVALCRGVRHLKILSNTTLVRLHHHVGALSVVHHRADTLVKVNIAFKVVLDETLTAVVLIVGLTLPFASGVADILLLNYDWHIGKGEISG